MTAALIEVLDRLKSEPVFAENLFFAGGTALSYYLKHRISEDLDFISAHTLDHKLLSSVLLKHGAQKIQDENAFALRLAGLFPDEHLLKFRLGTVKVEFFKASRKAQLDILKNASASSYENSHIQILDIRSIAKLKVVALLARNKSRDLYDFAVMLEHAILSREELTGIAKEERVLGGIEELTAFIGQKTQSKEDEPVYLGEENRIDLPFDEIKARALRALEMLRY